MKTTIMTFVLACVALGGHAQTNKNVEETTKTTVTKVKTSDGEKRFVKNETVKEVQPIELKGEQPGTKNIDMKETQPVTVTATTRVTNPDGTTRTVDTDRSSFYMNRDSGTKYKLTRDAAGYTVTTDGSPASAPRSVLRQTSTNSYVFKDKDRTAIGYFDTNGDLILEVYDEKTDKVSLQKFTVVKP